VHDSPTYRTLKAEYDNLSQDADTALLELAALQKETDSLRELQSTWREGVLKEASAQLEELNKRITAKDTDLARIRSQREDHKAETIELRARDAEKLKSVDQVRTMANAKEAGRYIAALVWF
jgi:E3 ubiquitin-protein ligase BRE1